MARHEAWLSPLHNMNEMTPSQALQILSDATEPSNIGKISRQGFIAIQKALEVLAALIPKDESEPQPSE